MARKYVLLQFRCSVGNGPFWECLMAALRPGGCDWSPEPTMTSTSTSEDVGVLKHFQQSCHMIGRAPRSTRIRISICSAFRHTSTIQLPLPYGCYIGKKQPAALIETFTRFQAGSLSSEDFRRISKIFWDFRRCACIFIDFHRFS